MSRGVSWAVAGTAAGAMGETASEMNEGGVSSPSSPSRYCRRHIVSSERDTPCRRAVAATWRCPRKLSSTIRILSVSLQYRRRGTSAAERTSNSGLNLWSAIRSDLAPTSKSRQTASAAGILVSYIGNEFTSRAILK